MNLHEWYAHAPVIWFMFWSFAVVASLFYGWKCFEALEVNVNPRDKPWAWRLHQRWFNFSASLIGWGAFWLVFRKVCVYPSPVKWFDVVLMGLAFVGITGHLPLATAGLLRAVKDLALKALHLSE